MNPHRHVLPFGPVACAVGACLLASIAAAQSAALHEWKRPVDIYGTQTFMQDAEPDGIQMTEMRWRWGDDERWADPAFPDDDWKVTDFAFPDGIGMFWARFHIRTTGGDPESLLARVVVQFNASFDMFWDGHHVARSGLPAPTAEGEVPGAYVVRVEIPDSLRGPGEHVVAFRASAFHVNSSGTETFLQIFPMPRLDLRAYEGEMAVLGALATGMMFTAGLTAFIMWLMAARRATLLLFSALCLLCVLIIAHTSARYLVPFPYSWSYRLWTTQIGVVSLAVVCLQALGLAHFELPRRRWLLVGLIGIDAVVILIAGGADANFPTMNWLWRTSFASVIGVSLWALFRNRTDAWFLLAGAIVTSVLHETSPAFFMRSRFLPVFLPLLTGIIAAIAVRIKVERSEAQQAKLAAARLEIELLKRNLQPHFLLNTLTVLSETIEDKPAAAVKFIDDVATVFRMLTHLAGAKRIPLREELALCLAHLRVMSLRTGMDWRLSAEAVDPSALVPPAVFLTLIENGFSHQKASPGDTTFILASERTPDGVRFRFFSPGSIKPAASRIEGGTGIRYVQARLEESWPSAWRLSQSGLSDGWETVIELNDRKRARVGA